MRIHTVKDGENTRDIAEKYGIDETILCLANEIEAGARLSPGEQLLVLTPTRTYTAREGDTLLRVSLRFGQTVSELKGLNPHITGDELKSGQIVIVKYDERPYGMGAANGIFYRGCPIWKLQRAMPYLTYITVGSGVFDGSRCYEGFDGRDIVKVAMDNGKMPLVRVYDKSDGSHYHNKQKRLDYISSLIDMATAAGYKGIALGYNSHCRGEAYEEFLVELRGRMIGSDLILISEVMADSDSSVSDYSDGAILSVDKCADMDSCGESFDEWERGLLTDYADNSESTKTFIELPVFANSEGGDFLEIMDATDMARRNHATTTFDKNSLISSFQDKRCGSIIYNSLSGIKKRMDIMSELGYMGISFDIARCPLSYLLMYDSLFKSVGYANVDKKVRCNPDAQENEFAK